MSECVRWCGQAPWHGQLSRAAGWRRLSHCYFRLVAGPAALGMSSVRPALLVRVRPSPQACQGMGARRRLMGAQDNTRRDGARSRRRSLLLPLRPPPPRCRAPPGHSTRATAAATRRCRRALTSTSRVPTGSNPSGRSGHSTALRLRLCRISRKRTGSRDGRTLVSPRALAAANAGRVVGRRMHSVGLPARSCCGGERCWDSRKIHAQAALHTRVTLVQEARLSTRLSTVTRVYTHWRLFTHTGASPHACHTCRTPARALPPALSTAASSVAPRACVPASARARLTRDRGGPSRRRPHIDIAGAVARGDKGERGMGHINSGDGGALLVGDAGELLAFPVQDVDPFVHVADEHGRGLRNPHGAKVGDVATSVVVVLDLHDACRFILGTPKADQVVIAGGHNREGRPGLKIGARNSQGVLERVERFRLAHFARVPDLPARIACATAPQG